MEAAETIILDKTDELLDLMANFDAVDVDSETIHDYKGKLAAIEEVLLATKKDI